MSRRRQLRDVPGQGAGAVCVFGCGRPVAVAGRACWPCQSYEEYLTAPRCDCPHDPNIDCRCDDDCNEDCPAEAERWDTWWHRHPNDGEEGGQAREAPERSSGEA